VDLGGAVEAGFRVLAPAQVGQDQPPVNQRLDVVRIPLERGVKGYSVPK
jgi:hypothetical protein